MNAIVSTTSRLVLVTALLSMVTIGCDRNASDQTSGASGNTGSTVSSNDSGTSSSSGASTGIGASTSSAETAIDDSIITTKVKTALLADADIKGSDISVETRQGEVLLSGFVNNQAQLQKAVNMANAVEGVKKVNNKMTVKQ